MTSNQDKQLHKLLTMLTYAQRGALAVVLYDRLAIRQTVIATLRERLTQRVYEVRLSGRQRNPIDLVRDLEPKAGEVVCLLDLERGFPDALGYLDLQREVLADMGVSIVCWANHREYREIATRAPNFFAFRTATIDLTDPADVPLREELFVGREPDLEAVGSMLEAGGPVVLAGYGGVGKSTLALELTRRTQTRKRFQETAWINCETKPLLGDIILTACVALVGESAQQLRPDEQRKRLSEVLRERPNLLVLDNFETVADDYDLLRWLQTIAVPSAVLVTSRERVDALNALTYSLPELPGADAVEMFTERARQAGWSGADANIIPSLCERVGNLPLAIELLASRAAEQPLPALMEAVNQSLDALVTGNDPLRAERHTSIAACFRVSFDRLTETAQHLLTRLSVLPDGAGENLVGSFTQLDNWQSAADECIRHSMLDFDSQRYRLHPLIRRFALTQLGAEWVSWQRHFVSYFYNWSRSVADVNEMGNASKMNAEWRNIVQAIAEADHQQDWEAVVMLTSCVSTSLLMSGLLVEGEKLLLSALPAAQISVQQPSKSVLYNDLGQLYLRLYEWGKAADYFLKALDACRPVRDHARRAKILMGLAHAYLNVGWWKEAERAIQESFLIADQLKDQQTQGRAIAHLADIRFGQKRFAEAEQLYLQSLPILKQSGDIVNVGAVHNKLGMKFAEQKRWNQAESHWQASLKLAQEYDDLMGQAASLSNLAILNGKTGNTSNALTLANQALAILDKTSDHANRFKMQMLVQRLCHPKAGKGQRINS